MKKFFAQLTLLVAAIFGVIFYSISVGIFKPTPYSDFKKMKVRINDKVISVEVADTPQTRSQGLSNRSPLPEDSGMLFLFDSPGRQRFWMKGMKFPLDIIWIRDHTIVDLNTNVPVPDQNIQDIPIYSSNTEVDKVLEVPANFVNLNNIKVDTSVEILKI